MKRYSVNPKIGKVKHSVSFYDGISTHKDGSKFYSLAIFKTKKALSRKIKGMESQGYEPE